MQLPMHQAPRCGAKTRSKKPCQSPAMPNGRCRMHGGPSPGAPSGNQNALKHGRYSKRRQILSIETKWPLARLVSHNARDSGVKAIEQNEQLSCSELTGFPA